MPNVKAKNVICNINERLKILLKVNILTKSLLLCCCLQDAVLSLVLNTHSNKYRIFLCTKRIKEHHFIPGTLEAFFNALTEHGIVTILTTSVRYFPNINTGLK